MVCFSWCAQSALSDTTASGDLAKKQDSSVSETSIVGTVKSATGEQPVTRAIAIIKSANGRELEAHSDAKGSFTFGKLAPGKWTVRVTAENMLSQRREIMLAAGQTLQLDFLLEEMEPTDTLRIQGKRNLLHAGDPANCTFINKDVIEQYKSGNSLRDVVETAPGISQDSFGNMVVRGEHNTINYVLDGVVLPEPVGQLQQGQLASPHSLQSVEVITGGYQASAGGGPMGAIVDMQSLQIGKEPILHVYTQVGGPMQGGLNFVAGTPLSQDPNNRWNRVRLQTSGQIFGTKLGLSPPERHFTRDGQFDINVLNKLSWDITDRDRLDLVGAINESYMHIPTPYISRAFGFKEQQHDRQNFIIVSHRHLFDNRFLDESNLHLLSGFESQRLGSSSAFNPDPVINGDAGEIISASPTAKRFNFIFSAQGDLRKTAFCTHHLQAGFLSEVRPVRTYFSSLYYQANPADPNYGNVISPFTNDVGGPQITGNTGKYRGFRFLQSAYVQDHWTPKRSILDRFTVDAGARFDIYHGVFGNTMGIANAITAFQTAQGDTSPQDQFLLKPFQTNSVTNAQLSGRFAVAYKISKKTVARGSFSQVFTPPPVDLLPRPFDITGGTIDGIYNGSLRPMQATRGHIADASLEQQISSRFAVKADFYYKRLHNVGDELPVNNTVLYQRLTLSALDSEGVETRFDMRPSRDGSGVYGFVSNTVMVARLGGNHKDSGGIYDIDPTPASAKYIDHDRRETLTAALGFKTRPGFWILCNVNFWTGFLNGLDPTLFGAHPARSRPLSIIGLNFGYESPNQTRSKQPWRPTAINIRIQNIANNVVPINIGSPFQGTRFTLPLQVLAETRWTIL